MTDDASLCFLGRNDLRQIIRQAVMRRIFAMNQGITDILDSLDFGTARRAVFDPNRVFRFIRFWPFGSIYMGKAIIQQRSGIGKAPSFGR